MKKSNQIHKNSIVQNNFGKTDYWDAHSLTIKQGYTVDEVIKALFEAPKWVDFLIGIRDFIVTKLGLKPGHQKKIKNHSYYAIGENTAYLEVLNRNENEIVVFEDDKHLNLRLSIMLDRGDVKDTAHFYTLVQYNNIFGRLYFTIVKPFHRYIKRTLINWGLKNYKLA